MSDYDEYEPEAEIVVCPKDGSEMVIKDRYVYDVIHMDRHEVAEVTILRCPNCGYQKQESIDLRSYDF